MEISEPLKISMFTVRLCFLPALLLYSATTTGLKMNSADAKVITLAQGETVHLPLPVLFDDAADIVVDWKKDGDSLCNYKVAIERNFTLYHCKPQFSMNTEDLGLIITGVTSSNAGLYNCTVSKIVPPPLKDRFSLFHIEVLTLQQLNSSNVTCVELLCSLEGLKPEQVNFTWTKADQQIPHHNNTKMSSTLRLCKPDWQDGDALTCHSVYSQNRTVYSKNITLTVGNTGGRETLSLVVIFSVSACVGLLIILLSVAVCKCKRRTMASEPTVFNNKIYENFEPTGVSNPKTRDRYNPQRGQGTQGEETIYEN